MEFGCENYWWPSYDAAGPHPWSWVWDSEEKILYRFNTHFAEQKDEFHIPAAKFIAHLLVITRAYDSVGNSRKAGWEKPIPAPGTELKIKSKIRPPYIHIKVI